MFRPLPTHQGISGQHNLAHASVVGGERGRGACAEAGGDRVGEQLDLRTGEAVDRLPVVADEDQS